MGPIILFDKSALQALNVDEAVWFDHFFLHNISPIFFIETLADLEKKVKSGSTPEKEVGHIAEKTPEMNARPNVLHNRICLANLQGHDFPMDGRIIVAGGMPIQDNDKFGYSYKEAPEAEALDRWQNGNFMDVERYYAKSWRNMLNSMQFEKTIESLKNLGIIPDKCKTLEKAKSIAEGIVADENRSLRRMKLVFELLGIPCQFSMEIIQMWSTARCPSLASFSPYTAHVIMVDIFFYIAAAADLISMKKVTNKIDMAYLYYLPFCHVFTSSDKLHRRCAPLFLRKDQVFVWGPNFKEDLTKINDYYDKYPESEKEKGLFNIASTPPTDGEFLISKLWDRFCSGWRARPKQSVPRKNKKLVEKINKLIKSAESSTDEASPTHADPDIMVVQKKIHQRRGKWWQLPKDLKDE